MRKKSGKKIVSPKSSVNRRQSAGMDFAALQRIMNNAMSNNPLVSLLLKDLLMIDDAYNADIGHLNPEDLHMFDQAFVDELVNLRAQQKITIPENLKILCETYVAQREQLTNYHYKAINLLTDNDHAASKELGNFEPRYNKPVLRNEAEQNVFYDYIALYRKVGKNRAIINWRELHPKAITKKNSAVATAYENAKFAVLRIDKNLEHGCIKATNIITQSECLLIDRALNSSKLDHSFLITQLLDMGDYVMTSGGSMPIKYTGSMGKSILTLLQKHLPALRSSKCALNTDIIECVREIYGFCLRCGALEYMTIR